MTGKDLNQIAQAGNERTLKIAPAWERILRIVERDGMSELELDVDQLLALKGKQVGLCLNGEPHTVYVLHSEPVAIVT